MRVKRASDLLHKSIQAIPRNFEDVQAWFSSFQTQLTFNGVEEEIWLPLLNQFLTDKARRLVDRLPAEQVNTYQKLHNAILREYELTPNAYRKLFDHAQKIENETYVQLCTRLQIRLKYYVESRDVKKSFDRLMELFVSDKLKSLIPNSLADFVRQRELGGWVDPQELARNVDTFIADRNTSAKFDQGGRGGGAKDVNRAMLSGGGATGGAPFVRSQQPGSARPQHGGGGAGRGAPQQGGGGRTNRNGTQMFVPSCTFCSKRGHSWQNCFARRKSLEQQSTHHSNASTQRRVDRVSVETGNEPLSDADGKEIYNKFPD